MTLMGGMRWRSWLRHCAKSLKVAGSIPDGVVRIFHWHNPSGRTMALGSTQPLTEMSTRNISWGKGDRCVGLRTLPRSCADCLEIWEPQPPGTHRACLGLFVATDSHLEHNFSWFFSTYCFTSFTKECSTCYQTRHFFKNFTTNKDIATKFEADLFCRKCDNERIPVQISLQYLHWC